MSPQSRRRTIANFGHGFTGNESRLCRSESDGSQIRKFLDGNERPTIGTANPPATAGGTDPPRDRICFRGARMYRHGLDPPDRLSWIPRLAIPRIAALPAHHQS